MKIITEGFPDRNSEDILLDSMTCTYITNADCVSDPDVWPELTLETRDGGGGKFFNMKTNEVGWSFCDIEDIAFIINDFKKRLNGCIDNSGCSRERLLEETGEDSEV